MVLKNGQFPASFTFIFVFSTFKSMFTFIIKFANDCIQTADLCYRKQLLCQLSHNHCPLPLGTQKFSQLCIKTLTQFTVFIKAFKAYFSLLNTFNKLLQLIMIFLI